VQTLKNVTDKFGQDADIFIITHNHDMGVPQVYPRIQEGWNQVGKAKVLYLPDSQLNIKTVIQYAKGMDAVYCCGLFDKMSIHALMAHRAGKIPCKFYVAPMGVFSQGALSRKSLKKGVFLTTGKVISLFKNIYWSFTSEQELKDAQRQFGTIKQYLIAEDIPKSIYSAEKKQFSPSGELRIIFLSRICDHKNLLTCLNILDHPWNGRILFDIYGPREDLPYWKLCQEKIKTMPENVQCSYCDEVPPSDTQKVFSGYDLFLFPTKGENFGHVIYEALSAGCIPIISDKTVWNNLDGRNCGRVVCLDNIEGFRAQLNNFLNMDGEQISEISYNGTVYAGERHREIVSNSGYVQVFCGF
jgi:hypothetical protein